MKQGWLMIVLISVLIAGSRLAVFDRQIGLRYPDERLYFDIGSNLANHNRYTLSSEPPPYAIRQAPGLPFALGAMGKVTPLTPLKARLLNGMVYMLAAGLYAFAVWRLTRNILLTALMLALAGFHPVNLYMSLTNYPQSFQALWLACLVAVLACRATATAPWRPAVGCLDGVLVGVGAMFVPTQIFLLPGLILWHWPHRWRALMRYTAALAGGLMLAILPWTLRNAQVEKELIPFSTSGGEQLFLGFNPQAGMNTGGQIALSPAFYAELRAASSGKDVEQCFASQARAWIREHPGQAARLWVLKFLNFFRWNNGAMVTESERSPLREWVARLTSLTVYAAALFGCWALRRRAPAWPLLAFAMMVVLAAGHACFISRYRYRLPFEPFLLFIGVIGWGMTRRKETAATDKPLS